MTSRIALQAPSLNTLTIVRAFPGNARSALALIRADRQRATWVAPCVSSLLAANAPAGLAKSELGFGSWQATAALQVIDAGTARVVGATDREVGLQIAPTVAVDVAHFAAASYTLSARI